ncbi:hypothetical protein [uncultured Parabacteroides sp.]|nr:hypothetical protein [uncultured Parabacteroides sp.]
MESRRCRAVSHQVYQAAVGREKGAVGFRSGDEIGGLIRCIRLFGEDVAE